MTDRPLLLRRSWPFWVLFTLALLYFAAVTALVVLNVRIKGVSYELLAQAGAAFFVVLVLLAIPYLIRRSPRRARAARAAVAPEADEPFEAPRAAPTGRVHEADELLLTDETQQGLRVLEYSRPPKSTNKGAVYAKTYVPVTKEHVVRVETLAAESHEL